MASWTQPISFSLSSSCRAMVRRTRAGEKLVEALLAFAVAFLVWIGTVLLTGVSIGGGIFGAFWGYVLPPVFLLIGWAIYGAIDDKVESQAGALYDRATGTKTVAADAAAPAAPRPASSAARSERDDGLTEEQERIFHEYNRTNAAA